MFFAFPITSEAGERGGVSRNYIKRKPLLIYVC